MRWLPRHIEQCSKTSEEALAQAAASVSSAADDEARVQAPGCPASMCPLFLKVLPTRKIIVNHCYTKYRYSTIKGTYMKEITTGIAEQLSRRSPRLGLPGSEPKLRLELALFP